MLTRKDFRQFALTISRLPESIRNEEAKKTADFLVKTNPLFDRKRFYAACGIEQKEE